MRILLDTHIFLWFITGDSRLVVKIRDNIQNPDNDIYLSVVSIWESIIKYQQGRLPLPESPETYLPRQRERHQITSLAIDESSVARLIQLPAIHGDPFDRMLICQALQHDLTIATVDTKIRSYSVSIL
jgi:PIN domain nuclease of toxin-antitoxin system